MLLIIYTIRKSFLKSTIYFLKSIYNYLLFIFILPLITLNHTISNILNDLYYYSSFEYTISYAQYRLKYLDINYKNELAYIIEYLYHVILHYIILNIYQNKFDKLFSKPSVKSKLYILN